MSEKPRVVLPARGRLSNISNWNLYDILATAKVGEREFLLDDKFDFHFFDPEIEVRIKKPRDIPRAVYYGRSYGCPNICGITGRDLVMESNLQLHEACNLRCGYVDLVFAAKQELWAESEKSGEKGSWAAKVFQALVDYREHHHEYSEGSIGVSLAIDPFLVYIAHRKNKSQKDVSVFCGTEYPHLGKKLWENRFSGLIFGGKFMGALKDDLPRLELIDSRGLTEDLLEEGADLILENVATGESLRRRGCYSIESLFSSTAGLYFPDDCRHEKLLEIRDRIQAVVKDVDLYCQVRFSEKGDNSPVLASLYGRLHETYNQSSLSLDSESVTSRDWVIPKSELRNFMEIAMACLGPETQAVCTNLKYLLGYCPKIYPYEISLKYPCTNISKLRPEHRKESLIFSLDKESGLYVNYQHRESLEPLLSK
jgi:ATP phosphoribosyltransferase